MLKNVHLTLETVDLMKLILIKMFIENYIFFIFIRVTMSYQQQLF